MNKYKEAFENFWKLNQMENIFKKELHKDFIYQFFLEGAFFNAMENSK